MCKSWLIFSAKQPGGMEINYLSGEWMGNCEPVPGQNAFNLHLNQLAASMRLQCNLPSYAWLLLRGRFNKLEWLRGLRTWPRPRPRARPRPHLRWPSAICKSEPETSTSTSPAAVLVPEFICSQLLLLAIGHEVPRFPREAGHFQFYQFFCEGSSKLFVLGPGQGEGSVWPHIIKGHGRAALATSFLEVVAVSTLKTEDWSHAAKTAVPRLSSDNLDSSSRGDRADRVAIKELALTA